MNVQFQNYRIAEKLGSLCRSFSLVIILVVGLSQLSFAEFRPSSSLELSVWNQGSFELMLNNRTYTGRNVICLDDLRPGNYQIEVNQRIQNSYGQGGSGVRNLYKGRITIQAQRKLKAEIGRNRNICVISNERIRPVYSQACSCGQMNCQVQSHMQNNRPNYYQGMDCSCGQSNCNGNCQSRPVCGTGNGSLPMNNWTDDHGANNGNGQYYGNNNDHYSNYSAMGNQEFRILLQQLDDNYFDDQRMIIARQAIGQNRISTQQTISVLNTFNFESTKLEFAKYAYQKVIDPERYYLVNESFSFSSSIRELDAFITSN